MSADAYVDDNFDRFLEDLFELLAHPSISATGEGVDECTSLVRDLCLAYGFDEVGVVETPGQPSVLAHAYPEEGPENDGPTILIYGHYDVQPVTPELWTTPPFEPTVRVGPDGTERIYARGAGDNKGQWFAHLCAVRALRETTGLPVNVTLLLEGEEESGSPHFEAVVRENADELAADLAYVADGPIDASNRPHVVLGARGIAYVQLDVRGPNRDLHSGNFGGPVPNPARELVRILDSMTDDAGHVTIAGFSDDVRPITDLDRETLASLPFDEDATKEDIGVAEFSLGAGETYPERLLFHPTLNIAGFTSGYGGEGMKTIIPSRAQAKVDMRLVADQDPADVYEKFAAHVAAHRSPGVEVEVRLLSSMVPQRTPLDHPVRELVMGAVREAWDQEPILKPTLGGSVPTANFSEYLNVPVVLVPYANRDENNHSPDENLSLGCFRKGIGTTMRVFDRVATMREGD